MRILFISHDGLSHGGAAMALLDLIDSLYEYKEIEPIVLLPSHNLGLIEELKNLK